MSPDEPEADQSDQGKRKWWSYPTMSIEDRLQWLADLETYGPRWDFNYYNDDPLTEAIRDRYNATVSDPALRSEPEWGESKTYTF